jgi:hypothetical protein
MLCSFSDSEALADGQGGRVELLGRAAVGLDPIQPDYDTIGKTSGRRKGKSEVVQLGRTV